MIPDNFIQTQRNNIMLDDSTSIFYFQIVIHLFDSIVAYLASNIFQEDEVISSNWSTA